MISSLFKKLFAEKGRTLKQARRFRTTWQKEVVRYLAHGLLHLLGHDHVRPADAKRMRSVELRLLGEDGLIGEGVFGE